jgi:hypothetical protein
MYVGEDVELTNLWTLLQPKEYQKEVTKKQRQLLISQGSDPDVSLFTQDVAEPVIDAVAPGLAWFDTWKIPIGIGAFAVGGMLLLGYSGLGTSVGKVVERRIK